MTLKKVRTFLCVKISKWKRNNNNQNADEFSIKMFRVIFAFVTLFTDKKDFVIWSDIFMFIIYVKAVKDLIWEKMWKNIIHVKLTVLTINETWKKTVSSKRINIVISKWVFKFKLNINEFLNKFKTKFVTKNFSQTYNVDYKNIFTLIVKFDTL